MSERNRFINLIPIIACVILAAILIWQNFGPKPLAVEPTVPAPIATSPSVTVPASGVLATVNGVELNNEDFAPYLGFWAFYYAMDPENIDSGFGDYFMEQYINEMLQRELFAILEVAVAEDYLEQELDMLMYEFFGGDEASQAAIMDEFGFNEETVRTALHHAMLAQEYRAQLINEIYTTFDEEDFYEAYLSYQDYFTNPEDAISASHILVETEAEAEEVLARLQEGEPFANIAAELNPDSTRYTGGKLGVFYRNTMVQPFEEAAFALTEPGEISGIVPTNYGFHIIQLHTIYPIGSVWSFEDALEQIPDLLAQEIYNNTMDDLWSSANIVWNP